MAAGSAPIYRVTVTQRSAKAISYRHRGGATRIDFAGTVLMPKAHGQAKVESKQGYIEVEVEFRDMPVATGFGDEYLTYVLWAITPEGRTSNLGEILRNGTSGKLDVTTQLQEFGLIVTAEPYFAVSRPSDVVVMENVVRADTLGKVELIDAKYELLERGQYKHLTNGADLRGNSKMPLELFEARNAIRIARTSGADRFATETFEKAESNLKQSETYFARNPGSKPVVMAARQAVQIAEDARAIAVKRQDDDLLAAERSASADRELAAEKSRSAAELETERIARAAADARMQADAKAAAARAEADRLKLANDAQILAAKTEADRLKLANDAQSLAAKMEADRLKAVNDASLLAAQAERDRAAKAGAQAEAEKTALRAQLLAQFNAILQTRDTARGLIVNMSDVLFDSGKFSLRPEAREKLARVAGIVSGHPALRLEVEGHTDNVGTDVYNQELSEHRASAVRDYLTQQGQMPGTSVTTKGFGKTQPVTSNDTPNGRQQNRRVELVISGEVIGTAIGIPLALK
jgi:outer membrane protein OmpA-like peptidoglycan-associated protein